MATYLNGYSERLIQPLSRKTAFFVFFEVDIHPNEKHLNWNPLVTQTLISTDVNVCLMTISTSWPDRRKQQNLNDSKNIHLQVSELHLFKVARQVVFTILKHQFSLLTVERIPSSINFNNYIISFLFCSIFTWFFTGTILSREAKWKATAVNFIPLSSIE